MPLTPSRRSELRSEAHKLTPVVIIGDKGLTDEVIAEIDRSLKAHELIKIRAATDDRGARGTWMEAICERLAAHPIQQIGKILVVFRENFDKPRENMGSRPQSRERGEEGEEKKKRSGTDDPRKRKRAEEKRRQELATRTTRTSRPRSRTPSPLPESGSRRRRRSTSQ